MELQRAHEAERKSTVDQLTSLRDTEIEALGHGWELKVNELLHEVSSFISIIVIISIIERLKNKRK